MLRLCPRTTRNQGRRTGRPLPESGHRIPAVVNRRHIESLRFSDPNLRVIEHARLKNIAWKQCGLFSCSPSPRLHTFRGFRGQPGIFHSAIQPVSGHLHHRCYHTASRSHDHQDAGKNEVTTLPDPLEGNKDDAAQNIARPLPALDRKSVV